MGDAPSDDADAKIEADGDGLARVEARIPEETLADLREEYGEQVNDSGRFRTALADGIRWRRLSDRLALEGEIVVQVEHVVEDATGEE